MGPSNFERFIAAYQAADQRVKNFIDSDEIGVFIDTLISNKLVSLEQKPLMLVVVSNLCLEIIDVNQFGASLLEIGVSFENSHQVYTSILSFLKQKNFASGSPTNQNTVSNLQSEIQTVEGLITSLQPVRTMSHDMAAIKPGSDVVYQAASQADILKRETEAVILTDGPTPQSQPPRWDSETTR